MSKTALTIWGNRISPVYDSASSLLIADIKNRQIIDKTIETFDAGQSAYLIQMLVKHNVSCLICGAIMEFPAELIRSNGIMLIPFVAGNLDEILDHLVCGSPILPIFLMPGCRWKYCKGRNNQPNRRQGPRKTISCGHHRKRFRKYCNSKKGIYRDT